MIGKTRLRRGLLLGCLAFLVCLLGAGGSFAATDGGGPDRFGYRYKDSRSGGLKYVWEDIENTADYYDSKHGVAGVLDSYDINGYYDSSRTNYEAGERIEIGFDFRFYGNTYNYLVPAGNGYVEFTPKTWINYVYDGSNIGSTPASNLIAPLWGWHDTFS